MELCACSSQSRASICLRVGTRAPFLAKVGTRLTDRQVVFAQVRERGGPCCLLRSPSVWVLSQGWVWPLFGQPALTLPLQPRLSLPAPPSPWPGG